MALAEDVGGERGGEVDEEGLADEEVVGDDARGRVFGCADPFVWLFPEPAVA